MAFSVDDQKISDDGPTVEQAFEILATWCELADEAKPLFEALLVRLRVARDEVQRFYDTPHDQADRNRVLKALKDELVTFSIELQRYFGVRQLAATPEPGVRWTEKMFASRVIQHKKLHRKLYEMHGGVHSSDNGLDRLFLLLRADEKNYNEWRDPFRAAVKKFEQAAADSVERADMEVYKRDALLALEAVMLLRNAETFSDPYEWTHNEPAKSLRDKLKTFKDLDALLLPDWFLPENDISYKKRSKNGSFGDIHFGTWASGTNVVVKCLVKKRDEKLNTELREAFIKEADLWFKLSHPYILKLYGACHVTTPPFFVCEESREGDLSDVLRLDKSRLWRLLFQSALAIEYLHDKNIVHGDLKLFNILVGADGYARVADFGTSRTVNLKPTLRDANSILDGAGALRWRAPEALQGMAQIESDVYSFAMCLIEAIGGEIPYYEVGYDDDEVRRRIRAGELPERPTEMDDTIWELVRMMTIFDRTLRATIKDVIPELRKRAAVELESEQHRMMCPECRFKLDSGTTFCPNCNCNAYEVEPRRDILAGVDLSKLQQKHRLSAALSDYALVEQEDGISSVDDQLISDEGPTVNQALANIATWCELADEAKPLFKALVERLRTARDEVQRFYNTTHDQAEHNRCLKVLKDELVTFSSELQRYFGVRELTSTVGSGVRWTEKMFASRVLQHKKLHRKLYEMHGGVHSSDNGLDRLFLLLRANEKNYNEWRDPFRDAVKEFEQAVVDSVDKVDMEVYKSDTLLALEAVTLLCNAQRVSDACEWARNEPAKSLHRKLNSLICMDNIALPDWFLPDSDISYGKKFTGKGSFSAIYVATWGSGTKVAVNALVQSSHEILNTALREAFITEAGRWFKLSHPYLLRLYGACHVTTPPFFVCELSREGDLSTFLKTDRGKSKLWRLLFQSALAIEYLHGKRIVHGDLKLSCIFVGTDGCARLADFGMSRFKKVMLREPSPAVRWCAPEALEDMMQIQSDVYSFAMCLIEAISGRKPYYNLPNDDEVRVKIGRGELPERPEKMADAEWELVKRMTVFDPKLRATIKDVIPELMERASHEREGELDRTICPDCSWKLELGVTICPRCNRDVLEVVTIKSKGDVSAKVEVRTLSRNQQRRELSTVLTEYALIDQEDGTHLFAEERLNDQMDDEDWDIVNEKEAIGPKARVMIKEGTLMQHQATDESAKEVDRDVFPDYHSIQLQQASRVGDGATVCALLKEDSVDVNKPDVDWYGWTPLHEASYQGHLYVVQALLAAKANPNAASQGGRTPLHWASFQGHLYVVEVLLKAGADPNAAAKDGLTPLHESSFQGSLQVMEMLLMADANPNATTTRDRYTPLHYATFRLNLQIVEVLLKAKASTNAADTLGQTPLHLACEKHESEIVRALLARGANVHSRDKNRRKPMHASIESLQHNQHMKQFGVETLKTLQLLVSYDANWDAMCDDMVVSGRTRDEAPALRLCILLWAQEHADGMEMSDIPIEVIRRGADSTRAFIDALKSSRKIVLRRKICLVGSSFAGKTSFVKSITSELLQPQLEHVDDRTIGIDHFPLCFEEPVASRDGTKIHEVTFWDFAGQNAYQVAHSLFFSPRTLFLVVVDLQAFAIAYMQAAIFANEIDQEAKLLGEFVEDAISHWIRLILARQPDAEFVFIATKDDVLKENTVTEILLKDELMKKLRGVGAIVEKMKEEAKQDKRMEGHPTPASTPDKSTVVASHKPRVHFVSCTSPSSVEMARRQIEELIMKSKRSVLMPDIYTKALDAIVKIRQDVKAFNISDRISHLIVPGETLPEKLKIEPKLCAIIMQTLHDLGDVLWYEDLDVELFQKSVILDPLLLIDFIRQVITHKHTGQCLPHTDLKAKSFWRGLEEDNTLMEAMKRLLQFFHLVYSASEDRIMRWDSDLIVPAYWQTKTPASWKFLGDFLRLKALKNVVDGERVRVRWEFHFAYGLPLALFDQIVVATLSSFFSFDAGPDWILYESREGFTACRLMRRLDTTMIGHSLDQVGQLKIRLDAVSPWTAPALEARLVKTGRDKKEKE